MQTEKSEELFRQAVDLMPGGVNSPVRAFKSVGGTPRFIDRGEGAYIFDVDGNRYLDFVMSWGPLTLGHAHEEVVSALETAVRRGTSYGAPTAVENELATLVIDTVPSVEMIRFVNSGTEACMSALRTARTHTGREKIIKFSGNYHGHADMLLASAGSGVATLGLPDSPGVPKDATTTTLVAPYNNLQAVETLFQQYADEVAAVIVEPVAANMGFVLPDEGFLQGLQRLAHENGALFIVDEVMTGFRASPGGAQAVFGLDPDLTCFGKVIGGGLPVGAYAGKRAVMEHVAPAGPMYQAGTLAGNPLAMTAGLVTIRKLLEGDVFDQTAENTKALVEGVSDAAEHAGIPLQPAHIGTMFGMYFLKDADVPIRDFDSAKGNADTERYGKFFHGMLEQGVYFAPSQFEAGFMSAAHTVEDITDTIRKAQTVMQSLAS